MSVLYNGVCWIRRKDELPEDGTVCVFHAARNVADNIRFGFYYRDFFYESQTTMKMSMTKGNAFSKGKVDYWMPIPVLPES